MKCLLISALAVFLTASFLTAQPPQQDKEKQASASPMTPAARLAAARTAFIKKSGGEDAIAFDVVSTTLEGWGRFALVDAPEKADIVVEIVTGEDNRPAAGPASIKPSRRSGGMAPSGSASHTISQIKLVVYDAKSKFGLWTGSERIKPASKKIDQENNEVEAAQRLVSRFHDELEP
jgi:hypothetical protein